MARKPNYRFERQERDRRKAVKKQERQEKLAERAKARKEDDQVEGDSTETSSEPEQES